MILEYKSLKIKISQRTNNSQEEEKMQFNKYFCSGEKAKCSCDSTG